MLNLYIKPIYFICLGCVYKILIVNMFSCLLFVCAVSLPFDRAWGGF